MDRVKFNSTRASRMVNLCIHPPPSTCVNVIMNNQSNETFSANNVVENTGRYFTIFNLLTTDELAIIKNYLIILVEAAILNEFCETENVSVAVKSYAELLPLVIQENEATGGTVGLDSLFPNIDDGLNSLLVPVNNAGKIIKFCVSMQH